MDRQLPTVRGDLVCEFTLKFKAEERIESIKLLNRVDDVELLSYEKNIKFEIFRRRPTVCWRDIDCR